jgi:hypothetical protein
MPAIRSLHWQSSSICLPPEPVTERRPFSRPCSKFATQPLEHALEERLDTGHIIGLSLILDVLDLHGRIR